MEIIFNSLENVNSISLYGIISNIETYTDELFEKYKKILYVGNDREKYDDSVGNIIIKSKNINSIYLYILPRIIKFTVENFKINPEIFDMKLFKFPRLQQINLHNCIINNLFVYNKIDFINIQHSIINIDLIHLLRKSKRYFVTHMIMIFQKSY